MRSATSARTHTGPCPWLSHRGRVLGAETERWRNEGLVASDTVDTERVLSMRGEFQEGEKRVPYARRARVHWALDNVLTLAACDPSAKHPPGAYGS
jgi:hypothetical protein